MEKLHEKEIVTCEEMKQMRRGLSRVKTRISIVLFVIGIALLVAGYFVQGWVTTIPALVLVVVGFFVRPSTCPTCGKYGAPAPQWSQPGKYHCRYCGSRFAYDDEPDE